MQLDSITSHVGFNLYSIEYHSGEPFRWKWNQAQALVAAATYDASPILILNGTYFGFDGDKILSFDSYDVTTGHYSNVSTMSVYKINPKNEYIEKVSSNIYNGLSNTITLPAGLYNIGGLYGGGFTGNFTTKTTYNPGYSLVAKPTFVCECGGKKTFNEINEHSTVNHSRWCPLVVNGITK